MATNPNIGGPPVPSQTPMLTDVGLPTIAWLMFFKAIEMVCTHFESICQTGMPLTDTYEDVPDCDVQLTLSGIWIVFGVFSAQLIGPAENGFHGALDVNGVPQDATAEFGNEAGFGNCTVMMFWILKNITTDVVNPTIAKLRAKTNVTGAGRLNPDSSKIVAIYLRPS